MKTSDNESIADVCLILEGTYPFTKGGVSTWTHDLISMQPHLSFYVVALVAPDADPKLAYELPTNIVGLNIIRLQHLPKPKDKLLCDTHRQLIDQLKLTLPSLVGSVDQEKFDSLLRLFSINRHSLGETELLNNFDIWNLIQSMYQNDQPLSPFLDYYWSWRGVFGGLFSILLAELPSARLYHAISTGYAGLLLARAKEETGCPCLITEHGIYNNERRIEIASAVWLEDARDHNLLITGRGRDIKDFWISVFQSYARLAYDAADEIITLFHDNQNFQIADGAQEDKLRVIPNGIDINRFQTVVREQNHQPTVALIGRVVPIKDIKTFIRAISNLVQIIPNVHAMIIGGEDEDPDYAKECHELVQYYGLQHIVTFTGSVRLEDYLGYIDIVALTSISESQPLVILEAGCLGIPCVATDVGSCRELIEGRADECPELGVGGIIVPIVNAEATAAALAQLLQNRAFYNSCARTMRERVSRYYNKREQQLAYADLYQSHLDRVTSQLAFQINDTNRGGL